MALIKRFDKSTMQHNSLHGEVDAEYAIFEYDGRYILQIDTFGSKARAMPGKKSQTIQLGPEGILQLREILGQVPQTRRNSS